MDPLNDSSVRYKQQVKCQPTLAKASSSRATASITSTLANGKSPAAPAVKFSDDTKQLQYINSIRKAPVGAQIKRVIGLLFEIDESYKKFVRIVFPVRSEAPISCQAPCPLVCLDPIVQVLICLVMTREAFTPEQINEEIYVDINSNKSVFDSLRNNPKVRYDGTRFSYKSKHALNDKSQLLVLIRKFPEGIAVIDLKDSYPTVVEDLQALKASGQIWLLSNFDSQEDIAYPNDPRAVIKVDDDLKQLFRGIELPRDMLDIEKDLQKNGMKPATHTAKRRAMAQVHGIPLKPKTKKKKNEISKRTKLTNAHLPELFQHLNPSSS
ncbi:hypothetical protein OROHE_006626 [Orobanche hederae]